MSASPTVLDVLSIVMAIRERQFVGPPLPSGLHMVRLERRVAALHSALITFAIDLHAIPLPRSTKRRAAALDLRAMARTGAQGSLPQQMQAAWP